VERVGVAIGENGAAVDADEDALKLDLIRASTKTNAKLLKF